MFIHIWDKRQAFKSEDHFKAYFYKALRNNTVKYITRNKHVLNLESAENKESDDVLLKITEIEFNREISRAISLLSEKRREIILLSMSGMSEQMIADTLNISINTVKNQKTKAYAFLRQELKDISSFVLLFGLWSLFLTFQRVYDLGSYIVFVNQSDNLFTLVFTPYFVYGWNGEV